MMSAALKLAVLVQVVLLPSWSTVRWYGIGHFRTGWYYISGIETVGIETAGSNVVDSRQLIFCANCCHVNWSLICSPAVCFHGGDW